MPIITEVDSAAYELCAVQISTRDNSEPVEKKFERLNGKRALCHAPIFSIGPENVSRFGVSCKFTDDDKKAVVISAEKAVGPVSGVGEASLIRVRPFDTQEIPNLGLPNYRHNVPNKIQTFFGDENGEVTGLSAVGAVYFDEKIVIGGIVGRKFLPVDGVHSAEATTFLRICLVSMEHGLKQRGEFQSDL